LLNTAHNDSIVWHFECTTRFEFVAFVAEEMGLVGSAHYVGVHRYSLDDIISVFNLECTGPREVKDTSVWTYLVVAAILILMDVVTWFILKEKGEKVRGLGKTLLFLVL
jgi:hypothetical protein